MNDISIMDVCVSCGSYAGEGKQICCSCEEKING